MTRDKNYKPPGKQLHIYFAEYDRWVPEKIRALADKIAPTSMVRRKGATLAPFLKLLLSADPDELKEFLLATRKDMKTLQDIWPDCVGSVNDLIPDLADMLVIEYHDTPDGWPGDDLYSRETVIDWLEVEKGYRIARYYSVQHKKNEFVRLPIMYKRERGFEDAS